MRFILLFVGFLIALGAWYVGNNWSSPPFHPYGTVLGTNHGVVAYSNGRTKTLSFESHHVGIHYSGMKWQCVEYARRWLITVKNVTFESVDIAQDIWSLQYFVKLDDGNKQCVPIPVVLHENGKASMPPSVGAILIWPVGKEIGPYGHVAVITGVGLGTVEVTEQNYDDTVMWEGTSRHSSRTLTISTSPHDGFTIQSPEPLSGWITFG